MSEITPICLIRNRTFIFIEIEHKFASQKLVLKGTIVALSAQRVNTVYCWSGNIREVLIFANFARRTNSRKFKNLARIIIIMALLKKNENSRISSFVKSCKIRISRKFKHAKITRSTVLFSFSIRLRRDLYSFGNSHFKINVNEHRYLYHGDPLSPTSCQHQRSEEIFLCFHILLYIYCRKLK